MLHMLKFKNCLIGFDGVLKLCDFGFARTFHEGEISRTFCGTTESIGSNRMFNLFTIFVLALMTDTDSMIATTSDIFMGTRFKVCIFTTLLVVAHVVK